MEDRWMNAPIIIRNPKFRTAQNFMFVLTLFGGIIIMIYSIFV